MTLNLTSHNDLLAIDWPWHNRYSPEYGESGIPYIELRDGAGYKRFDACITPSCEFWKPFSELLRQAIKEMQSREMPGGWYTNVRMPEGHILRL
jgi:hypothetical protein